MTDVTLESLAKTAAHWWANTVRQANPSNDCSSATGAGITHALASEVKVVAPDEVIDRFEEDLRIVILDELKSRAAVRPVFYLPLFIDYVPCTILQHTAVAAGLPNPQQHTVFPFKTRMWIHQDHIDTSTDLGPLHLMA